MGQRISHPVTAIDSQCGQNANVKAAAGAMQGWRSEMEDRHTFLLTVPDHQEASFFGVFDGHRGHNVAEFLSTQLCKKIFHALEKHGDMPAAIKFGCLEADEQLRSVAAGGSTGVFVIAKDGKLCCGNVGDSRAVLSSNGAAFSLSDDHKPHKASEAQRIYQSGGYVSDGRVNGFLAVSRSFGDFELKSCADRSVEDQILIAVPDVNIRIIDDDLEFVVLASDGIWDVMTNQQVVDFCRRKLSRRIEPAKVCSDLLKHCMAPQYDDVYLLGCDNMTVILICFLQGRGWDAFCEKLKHSMSIRRIESQKSTDQNHDK